MSLDWTPLARLLDAHDRFLVTSHVRPDGDALGSEVGMVGILRQRGKDVRVVNVSQTPPRYDYLDPDGSLFEHFGTKVRPADLADRLRAAGFVPEDRETVVVGPVAPLPVDDAEYLRITNIEQQSTRPWVIRRLARFQILHHAAFEVSADALDKLRDPTLIEEMLDLLALKREGIIHRDRAVCTGVIGCQRR